MKWIIQAAWHSVLYLPLLFLLSCDAQKSVNKAEEEGIDEDFGVTWIAINKYPNFGALREAVYRASCHGDAYFIGLGLTEDRNTALPILPPDCEDEIACYKERNVLEVKSVKAFNKDSLRAHLLNYGKRRHLSESPLNAAVFLALDKNTSIPDFISLCDAIISTYTSIWEERSKTMYGSALGSLSEQQLRDLKEQFPIYIKFLPKEWDR